MINQIRNKIEELKNINSQKGLTEKEMKLYFQLITVEMGYNAKENKIIQITEYLHDYMPDLLEYFERGRKLK